MSADKDDTSGWIYQPEADHAFPDGQLNALLDAVIPPTARLLSVCWSQVFACPG